MTQRVTDREIQYLQSKLIELVHNTYGKLSSKCQSLAQNENLYADPIMCGNCSTRVETVDTCSRLKSRIRRLRAGVDIAV